MKKIAVIGSLLLFALGSKAQISSSMWRAVIHRPDGEGIVFNLQTKMENDSLVFYVINGGEKMRVPAVHLKGDSLDIQMPVFESGFRFKIINPDSLSGVWHRASVSQEIVLPLTASAKYPVRFQRTNGPARSNVEGKWQVSFTAPNGKESPAIATLHQQGDIVTGSVLTPYGDDRYLEGIVSGDSLYFSGFDGIHSLLFKALVKGEKLSGVQFSGASGKQTFKAFKTTDPQLPDEAAMYLKPGESGHLDFSFKDLDGKLVSINDQRFKNKVVIIDLMGSWCPNCMDETAFLSKY